MMGKSTKLTMSTILTGMATMFVVCCCTVAILIQIENLKTQIEVSRTLHNSQEVEKKKHVSSGSFQYLSDSSTEGQFKHSKNTFSTSDWCLGERQKFLEFAARVVMLQEDVKLESSFEGMARKLSCYYGKKALSTNVPLKSYKVEIPCDESVNVDFKMSNQVKSHSIQDLKKYILESRDDITVMEIHSQIFLQFIREISVVTHHEQESTINTDISILMNTMMTDFRFLKQYSKDLNLCQHTNRTKSINIGQLVHKYNDDSYLYSKTPQAVVLKDKASFKKYAIFKQFLNYVMWLKIDMFYRMLCMPIPSKQCPNMVVRMRTKNRLTYNKDIVN